MTLAYLVPAGRDRFELYSEAPEEPAPEPAEHDGRVRRWMHQASVKWHALVEQSRRGGAGGRFARWRDALVCRLAETIAEQRTLWALRTETQATMRFPSTIAAARARTTLMETLEEARTHHLRWSIVDGLLFVSSVVFFFIPGPNLVAYYFAFRLVGHLQSWRGARQAMEQVRWTFEPDDGLAELCALIDLPREARAPRVAAIAERLNLRRLSAFFDRVAVRST
jgi:hypothetical protein